MKKAVIIGAGNIGRGFIGQLMSEGGLDVCFIDVSDKVVDALNERGSYPLEIVSSRGSLTKEIQNVRAVNGKDSEAASDEIATADIAVTCVGAKAIKFIIPNLVKGIKKRFSANADPLDLLICENLMDADKYIRFLLEAELTPEELEFVGLVETSVGRMVPLPDAKLLEADPLMVRAESYGVLPCDSDAFKGNSAEIENLIPISPFRFIIERKLYIHNMGHAVTAYLGMLKGYTYISEAIRDSEIRLVVREAMTESAVALSKKFSMPLDEILLHTEDLIRRFGNISLGDTCERVGADIPRKLANSDRLTGASLSVIKEGGHPTYIALGAAAAMIKYGSFDSFGELTEVESGEYYETAKELYSELVSGKTLAEVIELSDETLTELTGKIM